MARKDEDRDDELNEDDESTGGDASDGEREADDASESSAEADAPESSEEADDSVDDSEDSASESESGAADESDDSAAAHERERRANLRNDLAEEAKTLAHESELEAAEQLGSSARYVHAAFFVAAILIAFISSKIIIASWGALADWPAATRAVPQLMRFAEDERGSYALGVGALIGVLTIVQVYRRDQVRRWADEVALELTKVTWPNRESVTNGTIVVIVASMIATVYVALLDRFWSFLTHLVYGA